jgi:hypothetical protein
MKTAGPGDRLAGPAPHRGLRTTDGARGLAGQTGSTGGHHQPVLGENLRQLGCQERTGDLGPGPRFSAAFRLPALPPDRRVPGLHRQPGTLRAVRLPETPLGRPPRLQIQTMRFRYRRLAAMEPGPLGRPSGQGHRCLYERLYSEVYVTMYPHLQALYQKIRESPGILADTRRLPKSPRSQPSLTTLSASTCAVMADSVQPRWP